LMRNRDLLNNTKAVPLSSCPSASGDPFRQFNQRIAAAMCLTTTTSLNDGIESYEL
jgi:hypothetical protein